MARVLHFEAFPIPNEQREEAGDIGCPVAESAGERRRGERVEAADRDRSFSLDNLLWPRDSSSGKQVAARETEKVPWLELRLATTSLHGGQEDVFKIVAAITLR